VFDRRTLSMIGGMARRPTPLVRPKEEKRALLVTHFAVAVEELLADGRSYADLSVEALIGAVGISRSTFYSYFDNLSGLLVAMGQAVTLDLAQAGTSWFGFDPQGGEVALREGLRPIFTSYRQHQLLLKAITEAASYDAGIRDLHQALVDRAVDGLLQHVREQQAADRIDAGIDRERSIRWLVWMLERGLYQMVARADDAESEALLAAAAGLVWRSLYAAR